MLITISIALVILALAVYALGKDAPEGYEDADGFHYGRPK